MRDNIFLHSWNMQKCLMLGIHCIQQYTWHIYLSLSKSNPRCISSTCLLKKNMIHILKFCRPHKHHFEAQFLISMMYIVLWHYIVNNCQVCIRLGCIYQCCLRQVVRSMKCIFWYRPICKFGIHHKVCKYLLLLKQIHFCKWYIFRLHHRLNKVDCI